METAGEFWSSEPTGHVEFTTISEEPLLVIDQTRWAVSFREPGFEVVEGGDRVRCVRDP